MNIVATIETQPISTTNLSVVSTAEVEPAETVPEEATPEVASQTSANASVTGGTKTGSRKPRKGPPETGQSVKPFDLVTEKLNTKERAVVGALSLDSGVLTIEALSAQCWPAEKPSQANSWVRNSLRRLVPGGWVEKVSAGQYRLTTTARSRLAAQV